MIYRVETELLPRLAVWILGLTLPLPNGGQENQWAHLSPQPPLGRGGQQDELCDRNGFTDVTEYHAHGSNLTASTRIHHKYHFLIQ